jgi:hypothetical protein
MCLDAGMKKPLRYSPHLAPSGPPPKRRSRKPVARKERLIVELADRAALVAYIAADQLRFGYVVEDADVRVDPLPRLGDLPPIRIAKISFTHIVTLREWPRKPYYPVQDPPYVPFYGIGLLDRAA